MTHPRPVSPAHRGPGATARLAELAAGQAGVVGRAQLLAAGVSDSGISRWSASGRIHRIHPGVYAVGHAALSLEGRLHTALLYAGPDAAFSYTTAGWLWRIVDAEPTRIHLTVPGRRRSLPEIKVHQPTSENYSPHARSGQS